jgi:endonuclease YncB( thermonuclease family)
MMIIALLLAAAQPTTVSCTVTDGDTLRCGRERVRLLGIDAPETGKCRQGRVCVAGDPKASTNVLKKLVKGKRVRLERHGQDRYGRTLAFAYVGRVNLSCAQVQSGHAVYVGKWDHKGVVGRCARR